MAKLVCTMERAEECTGGEGGSSHRFEMRKAHHFILLMGAVKAEVRAVFRVCPFSKVDSF